MASKNKQSSSQQEEKDIVVPSVGESVHEGLVHRWMKNQGDYVQLDEILVELETDKATVEIVADVAGFLNIKKQAGDKVAVGETIATIKAASEPEATSKQTETETETASQSNKALPPTATLSPAVKRMLAESPDINIDQIAGSGKDGRLLKQDVSAAQSTSPTTPSMQTTTNNAETARRVPMSMVRQRIASRLVAAKNATAMLTTFNEINMEQVIAYRRQYKDAFNDKHGVSLGFMGFFALACTEALREFPQLNAFVIGDEIEYHDHVNLGVAVSTERGLLVPVIKNAQNMSLVDMELQINAFAQKAREGKITVADMESGTFTVSNGGVFGSLLSTPILNPPQSGILGMHKIEKRPIVIDDAIKIAAMMYVALSYDHRIADGKEAVGCLKRIKELVETPARLLMRI